MKERKSHGVQLLIRCVVRDPDGKIISDTGKKPAKSYVIQWLEFIHYMADRVVTGDATSVTGAERRYYWSIEDARRTLNMDAAVNVSAYGIVVGTGDTAETNTDFALETQLTEGVGAGNITHGAMDIGTTAVVGANVDLELTRSFTNLTGSEITVKEAGIYVRCVTGIPSTYYFCIIRDVLPASVDVPVNCSLAIIYTMRTTV